MDCIIQIFISDYPLANGCMESKIINTWYWYFFINIKAYGYLILILTLNLMSVYWMYYWSNKIDMKTIFFMPLRLVGFYMLISFLGSLIYLFILYPWYSAVFFIVFFMLVTNGIGRILDRKYDREESIFINELAQIESESRVPLSDALTSPEEILRRMPLHEKAREKRDKRKEEDSKLILNRGLRNIKIFSSISIVCNLYAAYQIFYYYQI